MYVQHYLQPLSSIAVIIFRLLQWLTVSLVEYCKWVLTFTLLFLIDTLDFETCSRQMLLMLQWGKLKHNRFVFKMA